MITLKGDGLYMITNCIVHIYCLVLDLNIYIQYEKMFDHLRQPHCFCKWKSTSDFLEMEDDLNDFLNGR